MSAPGPWAAAAACTILLLGSTACGAGATSMPDTSIDEDIDLTPARALDCAPRQASAVDSPEGGEQRPACEALALARGTDADRRRLLTELDSEAYLASLESDDISSYDELVLFQIIAQLAHAPGDGWVEQLIDLAPIQNDALRIQALIYGLALIRPPAAQSLGYWRRLANPDSPLTYDVFAAALANGSRESLALVGELLADPAFAEPEKIAWLRETLVPRRHDPALLAACLQWLQSDLSTTVAVGLIEALFVYDPDAWYHVPDPPRPPDPSTLDPTASSARQAVARWARANLPLERRLRDALETATSGR
jgi:hypothetical protein